MDSGRVRRFFARPKAHDHCLAGAQGLTLLVMSEYDDADTGKGLQACLDARMPSRVGDESSEL